MFLIQVCLRMTSSFFIVLGESDIGEYYAEAVSYLNQFLPENSQIEWRWTDIARLRKSGDFGREFNVECKEIADKIGITTSEKRQNGVVRVNCVDCLDRTNLTQVAIGLIALQKQLDYMGSTLKVDQGIGKNFYMTYFRIPSVGLYPTKRLRWCDFPKAFRSSR